VFFGGREGGAENRSFSVEEMRTGMGQRSRAAPAPRMVPVAVRKAWQTGTIRNVLILVVVGFLFVTMFLTPSKPAKDEGKIAKKGTEKVVNLPPARKGRIIPLDAQFKERMNAIAKRATTEPPKEEKPQFDIKSSAESVMRYLKYWEYAEVIPCKCCFLQFSLGG
jgi:hypothetical protein